MADTPDFTANTQPSLQQLWDYVLNSVMQTDVLGPITGAAADAFAKGGTMSFGALVKAIGDSLQVDQNLTSKFESFGSTIVAFLLGKVVSHFLDADVTWDEINSASGSTLTDKIGVALSRPLLQAITPASSDLEPGSDNAGRFVGMLGAIALESWGIGIAAELGISFGGLLHPIERISDLGEQLINTMGLNRVVRTALAPLIETTVATPLKWQAHKTYRPTMLTASTVARQVARGRWTSDQATEELARAGYSDDRIDALLNEATKFLGEGDVQLLVERGYWTQDQGQTYLQAAGYDKDTAAAVLRVGGLREWIAIETATADAIISAYAAGRIDQPTRDQLLTSIVDEPARRNFYESAADARRVAAQKPLTSAEAKACAKAGILAVPDYRDALEREGYTADAVDALELLLQAELDATAKTADLKKQQAEAKAATAAAKAKLAAEKAQAAEQKATEAQRGSVAELTTAFVRGLIPLSRLNEVLAYHYDPDTVTVIAALAQAKRADYVAKQQKAAAAVKGRGPKTAAVASLQQAVLDNLLTLDEYSQRLTQLGYPPDDVQLLTEVEADKKAAYDAAQKTKAAATAKAKSQGISLAGFETLVRRGIRSTTEYDQLLTSLGYDDAARVNLEALLQLKMADDQQAALLRGNAPPTGGAKGLTLAQLRRAVLLGVAPETDYAQLLVQLNYSPASQSLLMGELRDDEATAAAARLKRSQTVGPTGARILPLTTVARAARLGVIPPGLYQQRLAAAGYTADDIAIDMDLLTAEMATTTAAKKKAAATTVPGGGKTLTLAQVATAVKDGAKSLEDYRAAATAAGLSADAVNTLVYVLADELQAAVDAKAAKQAAAVKAIAKGVSVDELEAAVRAGTLSVQHYLAQLTAAGVPADEADVLAGTLTSEINAAESIITPA